MRAAALVAAIGCVAALVLAFVRLRPAPHEAAVPPAALASAPLLFAGCGSVLRGGACELALDRGVRVWTSGEAGRAAFDADGAPLVPARSAPVEGGALAELTIPGGTRALRVRTASGEVSSLPLVEPKPAPASVIEARALRDAGKSDEAIARLVADRARAEREGEAAPLLSLLARVTRAKGLDAEADALFGAAIDANVREGRDGDAANDGFALAFSLTHRGQFTAARVALERAAAASRGFPEGRARAAYYGGFLASSTGDSRGALAAFREAAKLSARLGAVRLNRMVRDQFADELIVCGRPEEAVSELRTMLESEGDAMEPCDRALLLANLGWAAMSLRRDDARRAEASAWIAQAVDATRARCKGTYDPTQLPNALGNLARAEIGAGHVARARALLDEAASISPHPDSYVALDWIAMRGELALADHDARAALAAFDQVAREATALGVRSWQIDALQGTAEARRLAGDRTGALAALARAADLVDEESLAIPLGQGRESFARANEDADARRVDLLVALGKPAEALRALRQLRTRALAGLQARGRIAALDADARATWETSVGAYRRERDAIDADAAEDWTFAGETLAKRRVARALRAAAAQSALDDALAKATRAPVKDASAARDEARAPLPDGTLLLAFAPHASGWRAFAASGADVRVLDLGPVDLLARDDALAAKLLAPFRAEITAARRLEVVALGAARAVDVHALPWNGAPLVAALPVVYPIDRRGAVDAASDPSPAPRALVVADPTSDLKAARAELDAVSHALSAAPDWRVTVLRGPESTGGAVRDGLASARLFQYAGHGRYAGRDGVEAALTLAEHGELTVSDVLALPHVPSAVVLLGCQTARESGEGAAEGLGLAQAFLLAGSTGVVAATRDVEDTTASAIAVALYAHGSPDRDLAGALREAQLEASRRGLPNWSAFRALVP